MARQQGNRMFPYLERIPGLLEGLWSLQYAVGSQIETYDFDIARWDVSRHLKSWLSLCERFADGRDQRPVSRIVFMACYPWWISVSLAIAIVLVQRGHHVDFVWLPYTDPGREGNLWEKRRLSFELSRVRVGRLCPRLNLYNLEKFPTAPLTAEVKRMAEEQSYPDVMWILRRQNVDIRNEGEAEKYRFRFRRNLDVMLRVASFMHGRACDTVVIPNGGIMEFGAVFRQAEWMGMRCVAFEFSNLPERVFVSMNRPFSDLDTEAAWLAGAPHILNQKRQQRVANWINAVEGVDYWKSAHYVIHEASKDTGARLRAQLHLNARLPIVLLCPNVTWDSAALGRDTAFESMRDWVLRTVAYFAPRTDVYLLIRVHPAEALSGSNDRVAEAIRSAWPVLPDCVRIIDADAPINTYGLMELGHLGLVYTSTTGLEMAVRGLPVICAARAHYAGKGFTWDPGTAQEFFDMIDRFLSEPDRFVPSDRQRELAWCYADMYIHQVPKPFPWQVGRLWSNIERWPMEYVLSEDGMNRFGHSFDLIAGRVSAPVGLVGNI